MVNTITLQVHETQFRQIGIFLKEDCPLAGLNQIFSDGIPIACIPLIVSGIACYELDLSGVPYTKFDLIASLLVAPGCPQWVLGAFSRLGVVVVPMDWAEKRQ